MGNAVTFFGALDTPDCGPMTRAANSANVFVVNNAGVSKGVSREGDLNDSHLYTVNGDCPYHAKPIANSGIAVFVNGKRIGRLGDALTDCTTVAEGSPTVLAG